MWAGLPTNALEVPLMLQRGILACSSITNGQALLTLSSYPVFAPTGQRDCVRPQVPVFAVSAWGWMCSSGLGRALVWLP